MTWTTLPINSSLDTRDGLNPHDRCLRHNEAGVWRRRRNPMGPAFVAGEGTPFALIIVPVEAHGAMTHAMPDFGSPDGR